jgi:NAD(P)-dependent dehydrogenase (short-subunit alcohol dehydrogenase family)
VARAFAREGANVHITARTLRRYGNPFWKHRHLLQPDLVRRRAGDAAGGDAASGLRAAGRDGGEDDVPDLAGRGASHDPAGLGSDPVFGGYGDPAPNLGGLQVAFGAVEAFRRSLACKLGPHGIRVVTLQTGGIPESISEPFDGRDAIVDQIVWQTMLGRAVTLDDVGNVAAFAASDYARSMTATALNITCGTEVD